MDDAGIIFDVVCTNRIQREFVKGKIPTVNP